MLLLLPFIIPFISHFLFTFSSNTSYFNSTSNIRFGVPTKPAGIVYVKFQNSKSLRAPQISLCFYSNVLKGTYLIGE